MKKYLIIILILILFPGYQLRALDFNNIKGRIVLQVEENGEAWYIHPDTLYRYYLGRPLDAFNLMRELGIGIKNSDLKKIPIAIGQEQDIDTDQDGLSDSLEEALKTDSQKKDTDQDGFSDREEIINNFDPLGPGLMPIDNLFAAKQKGKIFLQVEEKGEAWYIDPNDGQRYYLGRPDDAFALMRLKGLGISNADLEEVKALTYNYDYRALERKLFDLVNNERSRQGLGILKWNNDLALVAREHSQDLKEENAAITGIGYSCDFPMIHHEGASFGIYSHDRLNSRNIYYFGKSGENIALYSAALFKVKFTAGDPAQELLDNCDEKRNILDKAFKAGLEDAQSLVGIKEAIQAEIKLRQAEMAANKILEISDIDWYSEEYLAVEIVKGWMESPGHRANILEGEFDESGLGISYINGYVIATQVFIKRADCGFLAGPCCEKEGYYPYCYVPLSCEDNICG